MCLQKDKSVTGVKIKTVNALMMILAIGLCLLVLISSLQTKSKYNSVVVAMNDYSECSKAINEYRDASDFLTNQARLFILLQNRAFMNSYFYEKDTLCRREVAMEIIEMTHKGDITEANLMMAEIESDYTEKREIYAMKLATEALGLESEIPQQIIDTQLSEMDRELSSEEKMALAKEYLFNADYIASKDRISSYSGKALNSLVNVFIDKQNMTNRYIQHDFASQLIHIIVLIVVSIFLFVFLLIFVLHPLELHIESVLNNKKMQLKGSYELKYIAKAYNTLCERNEIRASLLKHKAEHDPLTGLINREAFNQIKEAFTGVEETIAYLIIDIDFFKHINDQYGHPIGDEILKKISALLMEQFRATDYVARIGGDEFAIIMTKFGTSAVEIIQRKIDGMNYTLQSVDDGLPSVSLSVGVAFSDNGFKPVLIEQADKALYRVKKGGRCNCSFYKSEE